MALLVSGLAFEMRAAGHGHGQESSGVQSLDVSPEGSVVHLLTGESSPEGTRLVYRRSGDGGEHWTSGVRVDAGLAPARSPHRGMDAQIAGRGSNLVAVWMTGGTGLFGSGPMVTAISRDGGLSWQGGPNPADDGTTTGHGFTDLAVDANGTFHLVWLDSRDGSQGLRYANSKDGGTSWSPNHTLKAGSCECCWNTLCVSGDAVHVLFRDRMPRDMAMISSLDGGRTWQAPQTVGDFGWQFEGCPHVGGGLVVDGKNFHAVVWSGIEVGGGLHHMSRRGKGSWVSHRIGGQDARRADVAVGPKGQLAVVWEDSQEEGRRILSQSSENAGANWGEIKRLDSGKGPAEYPRIVRVPEGFRVFWTGRTQDGSGYWETSLLKP